MATLLDETIIADTLESLPGWQGDSSRLWRELHLEPDTLAELRRQIEVDAGAMAHAPTFEGDTVVLTTPEQGGVTELDVMMASHISDLVHRLVNSEPGVEALRDDEVVAIIRPGQGATGDEAEDQPLLDRENIALFES